MPKKEKAQTITKKEDFGGGHIAHEGHYTDIQEGDAKWGNPPITYEDTYGKKESEIKKKKD